MYLLRCRLLREIYLSYSYERDKAGKDRIKEKCKKAREEEVMKR